MTDWPHSSNPSQDSNQGSLCFGKSERLFHSAKRAMDWLKFYSKIQDMYCQTLKFKICTARRSVGWRSDYEGHWSKEAITEFKISFIGIVYKATWSWSSPKAAAQVDLPSYRVISSLDGFWAAGIRFAVRFGEKMKVLYSGSKIFLSRTQSLAKLQGQRLSDFLRLTTV